MTRRYFRGLSTPRRAFFFFSTTTARVFVVFADLIKAPRVFENVSANFIPRRKAFSLPGRYSRAVLYVRLHRPRTTASYGHSLILCGHRAPRVFLRYHDELLHWLIVYNDGNTICNATSIDEVIGVVCLSRSLTDPGCWLKGFFLLNTW